MKDVFPHHTADQITEWMHAVLYGNDDEPILEEFRRTYFHNDEQTEPNNNVTNTNKIKLKLLPGGTIPRKMTPGSSGYDLFARLQEPVTLHPGERRAIPAGFIIELPEGYEAQIRPRSGLALKHGLTVLNSPGTIDSDYRGEVKVILINLGNEDITIKNGDRIAQMIISRTHHCEFEYTDNITPTTRNENGFGSTGV